MATAFGPGVEQQLEGSAGTYAASAGVTENARAAKARSGARVTLRNKACDDLGSAERIVA
jgi:hypothetical protein